MKPSPSSVTLSDEELGVLFSVLGASASAESQAGASLATMARLAALQGFLGYWEWLGRRQRQEPEPAHIATYRLPPAAFGHCGEVIQRVSGWSTEPWIVRGLAGLVTKFGIPVDLPGWNLEAFDAAPGDVEGGGGAG